MAISQYSRHLLNGLSTDIKPTVDIPSGMEFFETDTGKRYVYRSIDGGSTLIWDNSDDLLDTKRSYLSAGVVGTLPTFTDNGNGSCNIGGCIVNLFDNSTFTGKLLQYSLSAVTNISVTDGTTKYITASYNAGTPIISSTTDFSSINHSSVIVIYVVNRIDSVIYHNDFGVSGSGLSNKEHYTEIATRPIKVMYGLTLSESPTRAVSISAGAVSYGLEPITLSAFSSASNRLIHYYPVAGVWTHSDVTQYSNTQYSNGTDLVTLTDGNYGVHHIFRSVLNGVNVSYIIDGSTNGTLQQVQQASINPVFTSLPSVIQTSAVYVGHIAFLKGNTSSTQVKTYSRYGVEGESGNMELTTNKVTSFNSPTDVQYPSAKLVNDTFTAVQLGQAVTVGTGGQYANVFGAGGAVASGKYNIIFISSVTENVSANNIPSDIIINSTSRGNIWNITNLTFNASTVKSIIVRDLTISYSQTTNIALFGSFLELSISNCTIINTSTSNHIFSNCPTSTIIDSNITISNFNMGCIIKSLSNSVLTGNGSSSIFGTAYTINNVELLGTFAASGAIIGATINRLFSSSSVVAGIIVTKNGFAIDGQSFIVNPYNVLSGSSFKTLENDAKNRTIIGCSITDPISNPFASVSIFENVNFSGSVTVRSNNMEFRHCQFGSLTSGGTVGITINSGVLNTFIINCTFETAITDSSSNYLNYAYNNRLFSGTRLPDKLPLSANKVLMGDTNGIAQEKDTVVSTITVGDFTGAFAGLAVESNWTNNFCLSVPGVLGNRNYGIGENGCTFYCDFTQYGYNRVYTNQFINVNTTLGLSTANALQTTSNWTAGGYYYNHTSGDLGQQFRNGVWLYECVDGVNHTWFRTEQPTATVVVTDPTYIPFPQIEVGKADNGTFNIPAGCEIVSIVVEAETTTPGNISIGSADGLTDIVPSTALPIVVGTKKQLQYLINVNYPTTSSRIMYINIDSLATVILRIVNQKLF